mmetsp:Transcript_26650/g.81963  ORF Transcript_26650/g.81963 Transcript_26650/m.81963 type:complete len:385 (-) Transcript_26650:102-1256(-)
MGRRDQGDDVRREGETRPVVGSRDAQGRDGRGRRRLQTVKVRQALGAQPDDLVVDPDARLVFHARGLLARALPPRGARRALSSRAVGRRFPVAHRRGGPQAHASRQLPRRVLARALARAAREAVRVGQEGRRADGPRGGGRSLSGGRVRRGVVVLRARAHRQVRARRRRVVRDGRVLGVLRGDVRRGPRAADAVHRGRLDALVASGRRREGGAAPAAGRDAARARRVGCRAARGRAPAAAEEPDARGDGGAGLRRRARRARAVVADLRRRLRLVPRLRARAGPCRRVAPGRPRGDLRAGRAPDAGVRGRAAPAVLRLVGARGRRVAAVAADRDRDRVGLPGLHAAPRRRRRDGARPDGRAGRLRRALRGQSRARVPRGLDRRRR